MSALILIFLFTFFENLIFKHNNNINNKFFFYFFFIGITSILYFLTGAILDLYENFPYEQNFSFLYDYRYWIFLILEVIGMYSLNLNYIYNKGNHTMVNVGIYTTLIFTPFIVFILDPVFGFENTLKVGSFDNLFNIFLFTIISSGLTFLYFSDKVKNSSINKPFLLLLPIISLLLSFYLEVKMLQTYTFNFYIYAVQDLLLCLVYLITAYMYKEIYNTRKTFIKAFKISISFFPLHILNLIGMTIIAVEISLLFRRTSQIVAGLFLDKKKHPVKDYLIMIIFICFGIFLIY